MTAMQYYECHISVIINLELGVALVVDLPNKPYPL